MFSKSIDFGRNFRKESRFWLKFWKNLDFGPNFRNISIVVGIFRQSYFWWKFFEKSGLVKIL